MRMRTAIRKHKWEVVDVPFTDKDMGDMDPFYGKFYHRNDPAAMVKFNKIRDWCFSVAKPEEVLCSIQNGAASHNTVRVAFKNKKHATLFKLKWL